MQKRISNIPFSGTKEQEAQLFEIIEKHKNEPAPSCLFCRKPKTFTAICPLKCSRW